jgi:hypothetical protein
MVCVIDAGSKPSKRQFRSHLGQDLAKLLFCRCYAPMPGEWIQPELDLIVADHFAMLVLDIAGRPYNKAEHNRALQDASGRSKGSIEFKHRNISAVLRLLGQPIITGYLPA